jgi:magnesium chelatase family protein
MDRFDMRLALSAVPTEELLLGESHEECSETVRLRVIQCQQRQYERQGKLNSELTGSEVQKELNASELLAKEFMMIATRLQLSARACHRALRVARTLADMNADQGIENRHIMEALSYRQL